jgi:hypothetical protein
MVERIEALEFDERYTAVQQHLAAQVRARVLASCLRRDSFAEEYEL